MSNNTVLAQLANSASLGEHSVICVTHSPKRASSLLDVERNAMSSRFAGFCIVYVFVTNFDLVWLCMCNEFMYRTRPNWRKFTSLGEHSVI